MTTIAQCVMWYKTSPACYKLILSDRLLTIPSIAHLKRLSGAITMDLDFSEPTIAYLKARLSKLSAREKYVSVLMDEVKTDQSVEYVCGRIIGETEEVVTKGLLEVMVSSLGGKYHDIVAMMPVVTLKTHTMHDIFQRVLKGLTETEID